MSGLNFFHTFRRVWVPLSVLTALLQRTPVLNTLLEAGESFAAPLAAMLRPALIATAALGAYDTLAGATTLVVSPGNPDSGPVGQPLSLAFFVSGTQTNALSYKITGTVPPGLTVSATGSGTVLSGTTLNTTLGEGGAITGTPTAAGSYALTITAYEGANLGLLQSVPFTLSVNITNPPGIITQPVSVTAGAGQTAVFSVGATGTSALSYQWKFGTAAISGETDRYLVRGNVQAAAAGNYTCVVTDATGSVTTGAAVLTLSSTTDLGRIMNVSIRDNCGTGTSQLIAGFVLGGPGTTGAGKTVLVRGDGPTLASYGVTGFLPDPSLNVFEPSVSSTSPLYSNDGWNNNPAITTADTAVGAFPLNADSLDSALVETLTPAAYTANITGGDDDTGIALAEVYDATTSFTATTPRLINVSGRAQVSSGASSLIAGFVIGGSTEKTVLVRGLGPVLANYGVAGVLPDPVLNVYQPSVSTSVPIASNSAWGGDAALITIFSQVGASPFSDPASADTALLVSLPPGVYTANVTSAGNGTGVALVEVYEVP